MVSNNTYYSSLNFTETNYNVLRILRHDLEEIVSVHYILDHLLHVVGLVGVEGDNIVQKISSCLVSSIGFCPYLVRSLNMAGLRKISHQLSCSCDGFNIVLECFVGDTRNLAMHLSSTELLLCHSLLGNSLHYIGASHEHVRGILDHESEIGKCWRVDSSTGARSHDQGELRDNS